MGLAALIGIPGLALYLAARSLGLNTTVVPSLLEDHWWRVPVLIISAVANAWAEEVLVVGYLLHGLRRLGVGENRALAISAALRGSYHLYQGFGGGLGNLLMGLVFGRVLAAHRPAVAPRRRPRPARRRRLRRLGAAGRCAAVPAGVSVSGVAPQTLSVRNATHSPASRR